MKKPLGHIITSWVAVFSFIAYSIVSPTYAYAEPPPSPEPDVTSISSPPTIDLPSCKLLGIPSLNYTLPKIGADGEIYDIGSRYKILDTQTGQQLSLQGTFLTRPAAASLLVGLQNLESTWQIELNRVLGYNNACWEYRLKLSESEVALRDAKIKSMETELATRLQIRDEQINFLSTNLKPKPWYESGEFWFATGVVGGILITVAAGYAIGQVNK